jgi:hypothetical protein
MKKVPLYWALIVGLFAIAAQVVWFFFRFGRWNIDASLTEYLLFLLAGTIGGVILIYFLNRQASIVQRWIVLVAFLLAFPVAVFVMLLGGLFGPLGIILFPQIPLALLTWIGSLLGKIVSRESVIS